MRHPAGESRNSHAVVVRLIHDLPMFRRIASEHLAELVASARTQHLRRGEVLQRRGERIPGLYAVVYGTLKLSLRGPNGEEKVLRLIGRAETLGEAALFLDKPVPVEVVALSDAMVVLIPGPPLLALLERAPTFARGLLASLCQRLHELVVDFESTTLHGALERVAGYLDSLAEPGDGPAKFRLPASKTVIAARLGMTKETLSRLLRQLRQEALITVAGQEITLLDRARVEAIAHGAPLSPTGSAPPA
ncbi:MAG TPA: Crp/Fnr family transcriptional regulator [Burkholderiales bacterium]